MPPALEGDVPATGPPREVPLEGILSVMNLLEKPEEEGGEWRRVNSPDRPALALQT